MASSSNSAEIKYVDDCRQLEFKARTWGYIEDEDGTTIFYISGQTRSDKTVFAKVVGFQPNIIIAIPQYNNGERIKWNNRMCKDLFKHFEEFKTGTPTHYETMKKSNLYGNDPLLAMSLFFRCNSAAKKFVYEFRRKKSPMYIADAGNLFPSSFKFYDEMDPILKYTALRNLSPAGWIEITETILPEEDSLTEGERKFGCTDITITALHTDLRRIEVDASVIIQPTYISFDIECNSRNHNSKLPNPSDPANVIFQIGIVAGRLMSSEGKVTKLLTLFDPLPLEGVEIERFKTERSLLIDGFVKFVNSFDGDTFIGYNIMKFDWDYMIKRAELGSYLDEFLMMSRLYGRPAEVKTISWSSSAYKKQEFRFPECHGRVNLDAIIEIERNFRLPTYSLNYAAAKWLNGEGKDDVTPIELFMCYKVTHEFLEVSKTFNIDTNMSRVFYPAIRTIMQKRKTHGEVRKLRRELLRSTYKNATYTIRKLLTVTGKYCVQDTVLPVKLVEKMSMWTVMQEMSNTMSVPLSFLHTRGQQIKILSQIYRECIKEGIVIPMKDGSVKASEKYQGAIVVKAIPGVYTLVGVLDFASLYPTTMIVFNIDYTTLLRDNEEWPAHLTHILEWEDHVGCEHDPKKRKKDAKDVMCRSRRYRFKKVEIIFHHDGSVEYRNEGLLPKLEKNLLISRSKVKKEMFKCDARIAMHTGAATEKDIAFYKKCGFEIIPKGHLSELEEINLRLTASVHNAEQLAIKISCNSAYGGMGAQTGFIPFVAGAESVTAMGRQQITLTVDLLEKRLNNIVVYGDTDSAMSQNGCDNPEDAINKTKADGKIITHYLKLWSLGLPYEYKIEFEGKQYEVNHIKPNDAIYCQLPEDMKKIVLLYARLPLDLEYEKMYGVMMLLTMKRYFATMINEKGEVIGFDKKGCVLSRRDNCGFLNKTYKKLADMIVLKEPDKTAFIKTPEAEGVIMNIIYDRVHELFTRQISDSDLVIYIGIGSVIDYAKKEDVLNSKGEVIGTPFVDSQGRHIDGVNGPLDPRLVYPNIPQCILALKMTRRGVVLPANIRLEFLYVENKHWLHQGDKAEDYAYYVENKTYLGLKPDLLHYIEKQFSKPISELIDVLFPKENVMYLKLENVFKELINSPEFESCEELRVRRSEMFRLRGKTSRMRPMRNLYNCDDVVCGWDTYSVEDNSPEVRSYISRRKSSYYSHSIRDCFDRYTTSGVLNIRAQYIIDSTKDLLQSNEILSDFEVELYDVAKRWKNRYVIDRLYRQHKLQIRPVRRSKQTGDGLIIGVDVMVYKPFSSFPKGKVLRVVSREVIEEIGKKKIYAFGLIDPETNRVVEGVSRDVIAPFYRRDGKIMEDIVKFRTFYSEVVQELNRAFDYLTMPDIIMQD